MDYRLRCTKCSLLSRDYTRFRCSACGSILDVELDYSTLALPKNFRAKRISNAKYLPFLPVESLKAGLGEGGTPLVRKRIAGFEGITLYFKVETENPTRSFKDRGSAVDITKALELGYDSVVCASTGNMGMSIAHYAKEAGIKATIFISSGADKGKVLRIRRYGAKIVKAEDDFNEALRMAEAFAPSNSAFVCGDYHFRKEGQKTVIYEILEQMRYDVPDFIFVPVGNATLISAVYKGLNEYRALGWINRFPKLVAVQSAGCDPLVRAYNRKSSIAYMKPHTVADAIAVGYPTFGFEAVKAIGATKGRAIRVSDEDIMAAVKKLKKNGIGSETGGAAGFAGFAEMHKYSKAELSGKSSVIIVTGNNELRG